MRVEIFSGSNPSSRHLWFCQVRDGGVTVYLGPGLSTERLAWNEAVRWVNEELERKERQRPATTNDGLPLPWMARF